MLLFLKSDIQGVEHSIYPEATGEKLEASNAPRHDCHGVNVNYSIHILMVYNN